MVRGEGVLVEVEGVLASGMQLLLQARELSQVRPPSLPQAAEAAVECPELLC